MIHLRLKELREKAGLSQAEFAKKLSVSQSAVGMWETGKRLPEHDTLLRIAQFFHVSTDYLYGHSDSSASNFHFSRPLRFPASLSSRGCGPVLAALCRKNSLARSRPLA